MNKKKLSKPSLFFNNKNACRSSSDFCGLSHVSLRKHFQDFHFILDGWSCKGFLQWLWLLSSAISMCGEPYFGAIIFVSVGLSVWLGTALSPHWCHNLALVPHALPPTMRRHPASKGEGTWSEEIPFCSNRCSSRAKEEFFKSKILEDKKVWRCYRGRMGKNIRR